MLGLPKGHLCWGRPACRFEAKASRQQPNARRRCSDGELLAGSVGLGMLKNQVSHLKQALAG